jgi:hypothetical protein
MRWWVTQLARFSYLFCVLWFIPAPAAGDQDKALKAGKVGVQYTESVDRYGQGGSPPRTWSLTADQLPPGLSLSATGRIDGKPTTASSQPYSFELTVSDSSVPPKTAARRYSIGITTDALQIVDNPSPIASSGPSAPTPKCGSSSAPRFCGGQFLRTIVGFEQAGVSSATSKQNFFFDLLYDRPLGSTFDDDLGPALRSWGNLRISSVPQQINTGVAQFATDFAQQVGALKVNEVAQSFEFLGGVQYRLFAGPPTGFIGPDTNGFHRISINLLLGAGVVTPLSPQDSVQIFNIPSNQPTFFDSYKQAMGKTYVAFTLQDRNRFFRQAYGGLRLMTHYLGDTSKVRAPETFDLTYGFNESITGGRIHGGVIRIEGFVPIPYSGLSWIYFFGTGIFKPGGKAIATSPFLLDKAPDGTLPTNVGAVVISTPQADRDYYRIGVGIDFIDVVKKIQASKSPK